MKHVNILSSNAAPINTLIARPPADAADPHGCGDTAAPIRQIVVGDCLAMMRRMPAACVDAIVTSPPYNLGVAYADNDDRLPRDGYLAWMREVAVQMARLLRPDGSLFLNIGATSTDPWLVDDVAQQFRDLLVLQNRIQWIKSITVDGVTRGHCKPVNSGRYLTRTNEQLLHFTRSGAVRIDRLAIGVPYTDKRNVERFKSVRGDLRCGGNTWFVPYETVRNRAGKHHHPAGYPVELVRRCLKLHGGTGGTGTVLDPFLGSGTTLVAAKELGWSGVGIELSPEYADTARARLAQVEALGAASLSSRS